MNKLKGCAKDIFKTRYRNECRERYLNKLKVIDGKVEKGARSTLCILYYYYYITYVYNAVVTLFVRRQHNVHARFTALLYNTKQHRTSPLNGWEQQENGTLQHWNSTKQQTVSVEAAQSTISYGTF